MSFLQVRRLFILLQQFENISKCQFVLDSEQPGLRWKRIVFKDTGIIASTWRRGAKRNNIWDNGVGINAELNGIIISDSIKCKVTCVSKWWAGQKVWFFFLRLWFLTHCFLPGRLSWSATADHSNLLKRVWKTQGVFSAAAQPLYKRAQALRHRKAWWETGAQR